MRDSNGELKDGYTILSELAVAYQGLGEVYDDETDSMISLNDEMNALLSDIGGKYNINTLTAGLANFDQAINATQSSIESAGSANQEYETALDSITKKVEGLAGQFDELVTDSGLTELIKFLLDLSSVLLSIANNDLVQLVAGMGLLAVALIKIPAIMSLIAGSQIVAYIQSFISVIYLASTGVYTLNTALGALGFHPAVLAISAIIIALYSFTKAVSSAYKTTAEKIDAINESVSSLEESTSTIEDLTNQIADLESQIDAFGEQDITLNADVNALKEEKEYLETLLILEQERNKEIQARLASDFNKLYDEQVINYYLNDNTQEGAMSAQTELSQTRAEAIDALNEKMIEQAQIVEELSALEEENGGLTDEQNSQKQEAVDLYNELKTSALGYVEVLASAIDGMDTSSTEWQKGNEAVTAINDTLYEYSDVISGVTGETEDLTVAEIALATSIDDSNEAYETARDNVSEYMNAMSSLSDIVADYNTNGGWTLDNLQSLLEMDAEYLAMLDMEEGQLSINAEKSQEYADSLITQAQMQAIETAQTKLASIANGTYASTLSQTTQASGFAQSSAISAGNAMLTSGSMALEAAQDWATAWATISQDYEITTSEQAKQSAEVEKTLMQQLSAYESLRGSIGSYASAVDYSTGSVEANTTALEAQKEALEAVEDALKAEIDNYEIVIDYVQDMLDDEIDAIEEERDEILDSTQDKIDALEAEMDAYEEKVDTVIELLEAEMDAYEENAEAEMELLEDKISAEEAYWDAKIEALEKENSLIEDNIKLQELQEALALAQAQKVMVLEDGQFVYKADESAVTEAEDALADYEREKAIEEQLANLEELKEDALASLQEQLESLENYTKDTLNTYEQQIADMEATKEDKLSIYAEEIANLESYYSSIEDIYEVRLEQYESYTEQFEDMLNATANAQAKILYEELVAETNNWNDRIDALSDFVNAYDSKKSELSGVQAEIASITAQISSATASATASANSLNSLVGTSTNYGYKVYMESISAGGQSYISGPFSTEALALAESEKQRENAGNFASEYKWRIELVKYAKGTPSVDENEIALVGDDPRYQELAIGANYNKGMGVPMSLQKGTGIVPAKETNTLTAMLTNFANRGTAELTNASSGFTQMITVDKVVLEGVQDPSGFADALATKFKGYMTQKSFS